MSEELSSGLSSLDSGAISYGSGAAELSSSPATYSPSTAYPANSPVTAVATELPVNMVTEEDEDWDDEDEESEGWFGADSVAFVASMLVHMGLVLSLALIPLLNEEDPHAVVLVAPPPPPPQEPLQSAEEVVYTDTIQDQIGSMSSGSTEMAEAAAPNVAEIAEIPSPIQMEPQPIATVDINQVFQQAVAPLKSPLLRKGKVGEGTTGATGAVDRVTFEILKSMEERNTLVVWLFDESGSLIRQRKEILDRFDRIYEELGIVQEARDKRRPDEMRKDPLLTSIVSFGKEVHLMTKDPTSNIEEVKNAVRSIEEDTTGIENVFSAVYLAADKYKNMRRNSSRSGPLRNVMMIIVSDEKGDDQGLMEPTIELCRKHGMPVYVIGVPAPFGREHTYVKYVDPDPKYDQTPQWAQVDQGPETFLPERVQIGYSANFQEEPTMDSGFGPYALTRLCYETGGIYFTVHPNRDTDRRVRPDEISPFAAKIHRFFDPGVMSRYRPDYVSAADYQKRIEASPLRKSLTTAAKMSRVDALEPPQLRFVKRDDSQLQLELTRAQQSAAVLEPRLWQLYETLKPGEAGYDQEISPRWRAGFDLSLGKVLAAKVRTETYNAMLAKAKRGMVFENAKNNTWVLKPADEISVGSKHEREAKEARDLLARVVKEHAGTPWALLAQEELDVPIGWVWEESFTDLNPPRQGPGNNNNNPPAPGRDDQAKKLERKAPSRPVPKL